jgi:hypothetical protein
VSPSRNCLISLVLVTGLPALAYLTAIRPSALRVEGLKARIRSANGPFPSLNPYIPIQEDERRLLEDPSARWRTRIPVVSCDLERLALADLVVAQVTGALGRKGVKVLSLRASFDPLKADFTLPAAGLGAPAARAPQDPGGPEAAMASWVLEVEVGGGPGDLFRALSAAASVETLLEPVGLRWGLAGEPGAGPRERRQFLRFRIYYLAP